MMRDHVRIPPYKSQFSVLKKIYSFINIILNKLANKLLFRPSRIRAHRLTVALREREFPAANGGRRRGQWRPNLALSRCETRTPFLFRHL
jgi:hypothetical protein